MSDEYDFLARKLHSTQGRWISPDPAGLGAVDTTNPQTWNRYAYVMNNPLAKIDAFGLCSLATYSTTTFTIGGATISSSTSVAGVTPLWPGPYAAPPPGCMWMTAAGSGEGSQWTGMQCGSQTGFPSFTCGASGCATQDGGGPGANNGTQPLLTPQQQKALLCLGQTVKAKGLSILLDGAGAIPVFGNLFSGAAAGIQGLNAAYYGTVSLANAGNTLLNPSASGAANTAATAGFAVASLALNGSKAIPFLGTAVSLGFLAYDAFGPNSAVSTYQQCMAGPG